MNSSITILFYRLPELTWYSCVLCEDLSCRYKAMDPCQLPPHLVPEKYTYLLCKVLRFCPTACNWGVDGLNPIRVLSSFIIRQDTWSKIASHNSHEAMSNGYWYKVSTTCKNTIHVNDLVQKDGWACYGDRPILTV